MEEIKNCPFCGCPAEIKEVVVFNHPWYWIRCSNEECGAEINNPKPLRERAIYFWNRRVDNG